MADFDEDKEFKELMDSQSSKPQLVKNILLGCVCLLCFAAFMTWSEAWVAIIGVITVVSLAYISERRKGSNAAVRCVGRSVFITGCDTGFGQLLAKHLSKQGVIVFAGCLDVTGEGAASLKQEQCPHLHVLQMDVTNDKQVDNCVEYVKKINEGRGLWGLVNNAGLNFVGDIELTTMEQFIQVSNINSIGMVRVTKAFLPLLRQQRGRIVNVTSVKGRIVMPFNAAYTMTKYAGEAFSDILRMEVTKFGMSVAIIEPSNFGGATGCLNMNRIRADFERMWSDMSEEQKKLYGRAYIEKHISSCEDCIPTACFDLMWVINAMQQALFDVKPKYRYLIGGGQGWVDLYKIRAYLQPFIPTSVMDRWFLNDVRDFKVADERK